MSDIALNSIRSGYNLSKINDNFNKLQFTVNEELLHLIGGNNTMLQELDMNSNRIINVPYPVEDGDVASKEYVDKYFDEVYKYILSTLAPYEVPPFNGNSFIMPEEIGIVQVEVDGRVLPPSFVSIGADSKTITLTTEVTSEERVVVRYSLLAGGVINDNSNKISYYLSITGTVKEAIEMASIQNTEVDFEGLDLFTDEDVTIPNAASCRKWLLNGATLRFDTGRVIFNNPMSEIDLGGGTIHLGLKLAKVAQDGSKSTTSIVVYKGHELGVGDYLNSSLDIQYLPNSSDRVGYLENGDYNRITSILPSSSTTDTITLSYEFLREEISGVYSGLVENSWLGNSSFLLTGLDFRGNDTGFLKIHNGKIANPRGYYFTLFNGPGDARKATVELDVSVENAFLDMVRFRGFGITFGSNYYVSRQYDLAKQHLVCSTPLNGFVKFKSGCRIERQNGDAEVFCTPFEAGDTLAECGVISVDKGVLFNGTQPDDLPTSDFSPGGQVYFGYLVPIHDCYHFVQPNAPHVKMGGLRFSGEVIGFSRSIYGTTFSPKTSFETGPVTFSGAKLSCEPVFISITGGMNSQERRSKYPVYLNSCYIESRGLPNFDGGAYIYATQCYIKLPVENRDTPQLTGSQGFNFITMEGGYLDGRYTIAGSDTSLKGVNIPYSDDLANVPVFQGGYLPNPEDTHLILNPPIDNQYSGVDFEDFEGVVNTEKWFGSNYTNLNPAPVNLNFKFLNYPQTFKYGGSGGFARRYQMTMLASRNDLPPIPTKGKWSGYVGTGDEVVVAAVGTRRLVTSSELTTLASAASVGDLDVEVSQAPSTTPNVIGIYQPTFNEYIYYNIESRSGTTVTLGSSYTANTGVFPNIGHPSGAEVVFMFLEDENTGGGGGTVESSGVFVERAADLLFPNGAASNMIFDTVQYDDDTYFNPGVNNRVTIPAGVSRVDISGYVELSTVGVAALTQAHLRIIQRDSGGSRVRVAAAFGGNIGYTDFKQSVAANGIPVSEGDYFELSFRHNNAGSVTVQNSYLQLRSS